MEIRWSQLDGDSPIGIPQSTLDRFDELKSQLTLLRESVKQRVERRTPITREILSDVGSQFLQALGVYVQFAKAISEHQAADLFSEWSKTWKDTFGSMIVIFPRLAGRSPELKETLNETFRPAYREIKDLVNESSVRPIDIVVSLSDLALQLGHKEEANIWMRYHTAFNPSPDSWHRLADLQTTPLCRLGYLLKACIVERPSPNSPSQQSPQRSLEEFFNLPHASGSALKRRSEDSLTAFYTCLYRADHSSRRPGAYRTAVQMIWGTDSAVFRQTGPIMTFINITAVLDWGVESNPVREWFRLRTQRCEGYIDEPKATGDGESGKTIYDDMALGLTRVCLDRALTCGMEGNLEDVLPTVHLGLAWLVSLTKLRSVCIDNAAALNTLLHRSIDWRLLCGFLNQVADVISEHRLGIVHIANAEPRGPPHIPCPEADFMFQTFWAELYCARPRDLFTSDFTFMIRSRGTTHHQVVEVATWLAERSKHFDFDNVGRRFHFMGVMKKVIVDGRGSTNPKNGDIAKVISTVTLYNESAPDRRGKQIKSEVISTTVGSGEPIIGFDLALRDVKGGMKLGEKATFIILDDYAYGSKGQPGVVPPHTHLICDLELESFHHPENLS